MTWRNVLIAIFGAWFVASGWALNPMSSSAYRWTAVILGGLTLIGGIWAVSDHTHRPWRGWLHAVFGLYLGLTPFLYSFGSHPWALWITVVIGAATLAGGLWTALDHPDLAHSPDTHRAA